MPSEFTMIDSNDPKQSGREPAAGSAPPAWMPAPEPGGAEAAGTRPPPRGFALAAWLVIALMVAAFILVHEAAPTPPTPPGARDTDDVSLLLMRLQGQYIVGASATFAGMQQALYSQAEASLNIGSVAQRHRFIVLAAELMGTAEAREKLLDLDDLLKLRGRTLEPAEAEVHEALRDLYVADDPQAVPQLTGRAADALRDRLGWFGELALAPGHGDDAAARRAVVSSARRVLWVLLGAFSLAGLGGLAGLVGLVVVVVLLAQRRFKLRLERGEGHHGLYAETFAIWLLLFLALLSGAGLAASAAPAVGLWLTIAAFFGSLLALMWPVMRGLRWSQVRRDIGWTPGAAPAAEPLYAAASYLMALPILAVGLALTLLLLALSGALAPPGDSFDAAGTPAHPIVLELAGGSGWARIQILLLASIAAPIVEETMFRGVLYRHLREATWSWGRPASTLLAAAVSGGIFAAIHPQGFIAIPALMSLAVAFALAREWRGTLMTPMLMHAMSNAAVLTTLILVLSA